MRKLYTFSVKSSSKLFSCSVSEKYNRLYRFSKPTSNVEFISSWDQYIIFPKRHYDNIFSEKLVYELHDCIENNPHPIHYPNLSDSLFVKINGILVNKQRHKIQNSVQ